MERVPEPSSARPGARPDDGVRIGLCERASRADVDEAAKPNARDCGATGLPSDEVAELIGSVQLPQDTHPAGKATPDPVRPGLPWLDVDALHEAGRAQLNDVAPFGLLDPEEAERQVGAALHLRADGEEAIGWLPDAVREPQQHDVVGFEAIQAGEDGRADAPRLGGDNLVAKVRDEVHEVGFGGPDDDPDAVGSADDHPVKQVANHRPTANERRLLRTGEGLQAARGARSRDHAHDAQRPAPVQFSAFIPVWNDTVWLLNATQSVARPGRRAWGSIHAGFLPIPSSLAAGDRDYRLGAASPAIDAILPPAGSAKM
jgi:hypothetical protein